MYFGRPKLSTVLQTRTLKVQRATFTFRTWKNHSFLIQCPNALATLLTLKESFRCLECVHVVPILSTTRNVFLVLLDHATCLTTVSGHLDFMYVGKFLSRLLSRNDTIHILEHTIGFLSVVPVVFERSVGVLYTQIVFFLDNVRVYMTALCTFHIVQVLLIQK